MVFPTESQHLPFDYPPAPEPCGEVRQMLDDAVAALNADPTNLAWRKAMAEPFDGSHFLCEWGRWRLVVTTTRASIRPGCEAEARAWLADQGVVGGAGYHVG